MGLISLNELPNDPDQFAPAVAQHVGPGKVNAFDKPDGPSFSDLLDIINPLQHIPVVNTIYQHLTGDREGAVADVVGGTLYGGVIGLGLSLANLAVEDSTGRSVGDTAVALLTGETGDTALAAATPPLPSPNLPSPGASPSGDREMAADQAADPTAAEPPRVTRQSLAPLTASRPMTAQSDPMPAGGGPVQAGSYLIFGAPSPAVSAETPIQNAAAQTAPIQTAAAAPAGQARQAGRFMIFGEGSPAATSLPAADQLSEDSPAAPPQLAANQPIQLTPQPTSQLAPASAQANGAAHFMPMPTRRNTATPPSVLPMPTTGPAAVPGNSLSRGSQAQLAPTDTSAPGWFTSAFNQGLDKYQKAAALGSNPSSPATPTGPLN